MKTPHSLQPSRVLLATAALLTLSLQIGRAQSPGQNVDHGLQIEKAQTTGKLTPLTMYIGGRALAQDAPANKPFGSKTYTYQWPGAYFTASFHGPEVYFRVGDGRQILHVVIDEQPPRVLIKPEPGIYRISGLAAAAHTVRIEVVTESQSAPETFDGFALSRPATALPAPRHERQIEFIGDSHTVGYGNSSGKRQCSPDEIWATTDNSQAFGPLTAMHYHADYQVNAISGRGIVRNYNGFPADTLPQAYPYVLFDKRNAYRDGAWRPQVIVIALGENDFSTPLNPGERWKTRDELHADYEATYAKFLADLRSHDPGAFFILWATDAAGGEIQTEVQRVIAQRNADGDNRIAFIPVNGLSMSACDWHPSVADDELISGKLRDFLDSHPELWPGK